MGQHHYITICGMRYALEDLQHGAHPTVSTRTVIARLRRHMPLDEAKRRPVRQRPRRPRRFEEAVAAYLEAHHIAPLATGTLLGQPDPDVPHSCTLGDADAHSRCPLAG